MMKFRKVNEKLCQALECVPFDEFGISDDVQDQVNSFNFHFIEGFFLFVYLCLVLQWCDFMAKCV